MSLFGTVLVRVKVDGDDVYLNDSNQYDHLEIIDFDDCPIMELARGLLNWTLTMIWRADHTKNMILKLPQTAMRPFRSETGFRNRVSLTESECLLR